MTLVACSGGTTAGRDAAGDDGAAPFVDGGALEDAQQEPNLVLPVYAGRVVITPAALLFTKAGDSATLHARSFDAEGKETSGAVIWESSRPNEVTVDSQGQVLSTAAIGSSQIRARVGALVSAPVLVLVAQPPSGAVLVSDSQVVAGPSPTDPTAEYGPGYRVNVTVEGLAAAPVLGTMILAREGKAVAGRVVAATANAAAPGRLDLVLEFVSLFDLFDKMHVEGTYAIDGAALAEALAVGPAASPAKIIVRPTRPSSVVPKLPTATQAQLAETSEFKLGPFSCKGKLSAAGLTLDSNIKLLPELIFDHRFVKDGNGNWSDVLIKLEGGLTVSGTVSAKFAPAFTGAVSCKLEIVKFPLPPLGGPLAAVISFQAPIGIKGDITGTLTSLPLEVGFKLKGSSKVKIGFAYTPQTGEQDLNDSQVNFTAEPIFKVPQSEAPGILTVSMAAGGYVGLDAGITVLSLLGGGFVSLLEASLQLKADAKLGMVG